MHDLRREKEKISKSSNMQEKVRQDILSNIDDQRRNEISETEMLEENSEDMHESDDYKPNKSIG
jgi:hypothetical protein